MSIRFDKMPFQYTANFHGCKNVNFQFNVLYTFFVIFLSTDCGYTFENGIILILK